MITMMMQYLVKEQSQLSLGLPHPLAETVRPFPHEEGHLAPASPGTLVGQSPGNQGLPAPRGAEKQDPPRGLDLETVEHLGVEEGEENHLLQGTDVLLQTSYGVKRHLQGGRISTDVITITLEN